MPDLERRIQDAAAIVAGTLIWAVIMGQVLRAYVNGWWPI